MLRNIGYTDCCGRGVIVILIAAEDGYTDCSHIHMYTDTFFRSIRSHWFVKPLFAVEARGCNRNGGRQMVPQRVGALPGFESSFPLGPATTEECADWPFLIVRSLFEKGDGKDSHRKTHFEAHLKRGIAACSDYSGLWGDREGMMQVMIACEKQFGWDVAADAWRFHRACDIEHLAKRSLAAGSDSQPCVLHDLMDRLPQVAREWVEAAAPDPHVPVDQAVACYKDILQWLDLNRTWAFPADAQSYCCVHDCCCYAHPSFVLSNGGEHRASPVPKRRRVSDESSSASAVSAVRPLFMNSAGTTCTGWTPTGNRLRHADPSEKVHAVWVMERKALAEREEEDVFFQENSSAYDYQDKIVDPLDTHTVLRVKWSPDSGGFPVRRPRSFCAGLNNQTMVWTGPEPADVQEHFASFFGRSLAVDGDVWLQATDEMVQAERRRLALTRGNHIGMDNLESFGTEEMLSKLLPPGQVQRYRSYNSKRVEQGVADGACWIADLEQWPDKGKSTPGRLMPSNLTHGTLWSWALQRPVTALEQFYAHGYHVFPRDGSPFVCKLLPHLLTLKSSQLKHLVGNGFHLPSMAAWQVYILSHTVKINRIMSIEPEMAMHVGDSLDSVDNDLDGAEQEFAAIAG